MPLLSSAAVIEPGRSGRAWLARRLLRCLGKRGTGGTTMRAIWSGHITFGLITIPVGVYSAVEASEHVSFRLLHRKDMAPITYKKFCSKEDVEVPNDELVKGYE